MPEASSTASPLAASSRLYAALLAAGLLAGGALAAWTWARAASMSADGAHYMELADRAARLGAGAGMDWYSGPGYPVVASWLYGATGDLEFAGRLTSFLFGLGMLVGLAALAWRLFSREIAAVAVGLLAVHLTFVRHSVMAETDVAYGCWLLWSLALVWELKHATTMRRQAVFAGLLGMTLGAAYLTRPEAVPLAGLVALWFVFASSHSRTLAPSYSGFLVRLGLAALFGTIMLAIASPYLIELHRELGRWSLSGKERSIVLKFVPDRLNYEEVLKLGVSGAILRRPSNVLHWMPYHLYWGVPQLVKALHPIVILLALVGLLVRRRTTAHARGAFAFLLWTSVPFILFFFLTFPGRRYFMQALPAWTLLAAVGTVELAARVAAWRSRWAAGASDLRLFACDAVARRAFVLAVAAPLALMAVCTWFAHRTPIQSSLASERKIGEQLHEIAGPGRRVLSFTVPAFYARGERVPLWGPMEGIVRCHGYGRPLSYESLRDYVRQRDVEFVVFDEDIEADCPEFLDHVRPTDYELVIDASDEPHRPARVYRVVGRPDATMRAN